MDGGIIITFVVSMQSICNFQSGSFQNIDSRSIDPLELGHGPISKKKSVFLTQNIFFEPEVVL